MPQTDSSENQKPAAANANDSTIFRTKVEPVKEPPTSPQEKKEPAGPQITTPSFTPKPPSISEIPLITKLLNIDDDHFNIPEDTKFLNEFILSEMKRQNLSDTEESYKSVLDFLISKTKVPNDLDIYAKLEHLREYARITKKLLDAAQEREDLLKKDPKDMTSMELKKYIENK